MKDISYIAAFPKSGITYLNFMLFHVLFDRPQDARLIDSDYIYDVHESLARVPPQGEEPRYLKIHFSYSMGIPLRERAARAVYLLRDPVDVMMSVWDFKHLMGEDGLLDAAPAQRAAAVSAVKVATSAAGFFVGSQGIQLHGGMGMTEEFPVGHYFKRLVALEKAYGDGNWHLARYAALRVEQG